MLVDTKFHHVAQPLFYASLDARLVRPDLAISLLHHPHLAKYVRHLTERGAITHTTLAAISACTNLTSLTWIDDLPSSPHSPSAFSRNRNADTETRALISLAAQRTRLPHLSSLTLRTYNDLTPEAWTQLTAIPNLTRLSLWCFASLGNTWSSGLLAESLTHLELCVGALSSADCISLFSGLPLLQDLRLKGAPSSIIPRILALLPALHTLDTDFMWRRQSTENYQPHPAIQLRHLAVRTSTSTHERMYAWLDDLGQPTDSFRLQAFAFRTTHVVPSGFVRGLPSTLREFMVGEAQLHPVDLQFLCQSMRGLERLECGLRTSEISVVQAAIQAGKKLREIKIFVEGIKLGLEQATEWMLGHENLRVIGVNSDVFKGTWVAGPALQVEEAIVDGNRWGT
ncbi:hypothetical protein HMN09_01018400 [Mycena chlorophos]|uniref:F-box domain-containing protein n=1 Tax=Mycena chlorophos TaxID=658473 RepID=A0A8H6SFU0_MYCCL|nr:hypothetical protein HMN09_01018400 [Mycena chlorophos]